MEMSEELGPFDDTICGACGNAYGDHYFEGDDVFCNDYTNGDWFTRDPTHETLMSYMESKFPLIVEAAIEAWRSETLQPER